MHLVVVQKAFYKNEWKDPYLNLNYPSYSHFKRGEFRCSTHSFAILQRTDSIRAFIFDNADLICKNCTAHYLHWPSSIMLEKHKVCVVDLGANKRFGAYLSWKRYHLATSPQEDSRVYGTFCITSNFYTRFYWVLVSMQVVYNCLRYKTMHLTCCSQTSHNHVIFDLSIVI